MKRKFINKSKWIRLKKFKERTLKINEDMFNGYIYCLYAQEVNKKFIASNGENDILILDNNYIWLQLVPMDKHYIFTIVFDENKNIVQWYINITNMNGIDLDGRIFYDDMYLSIIVNPDGKITLLNENEINLALNNNLITSEQYKLAYKEARDIMDIIRSNKLDYLKEKSFEVLSKIEL